MARDIGWIGVAVLAVTSACAGTATTEESQAVPPQATNPAPTAAVPSAPSSSATSGATAAMPASSSMTATPAPVNAPMAQPTQPTMPIGPEPILDECGLKTKFAGDQYCINPPPPDKGFQIHIGPSNYENPEPNFILEPGGELTENFTATTGNDTTQYYFYRQQRMRPGSHHLLIRDATSLIVSSQNPVADTPRGGKIAPEDEGVGFQIGARSLLNVGLHFINTSDQPILKEVWINFWYKDASTVTEQPTAIFSGAPINVPPGAHVVIGSDCPITGSGRLLRLFGHKHANNVRWSTYRIRGDQRDLLFEDYDHWEDPLILEYSSITQNPKPDRANKVPGGWSGMVDLQPGDIFRYECEIVNNTDQIFIGQNEAVDDEMCIQNGTIVGTTITRGTCTSVSTSVTD